MQGLKIIAYSLQKYIWTILSTHEHKICVHYLLRSTKVQHYNLYLATTTIQPIHLLASFIFQIEGGWDGCLPVMLMMKAW